MGHPDPPRPFRPPPALVALAAWVLPGLGYALIRARARGLTIGVTVLALFVGGLLIGGVRSLEVPLDEQGLFSKPFSKQRLVEEIARKPWYVAQVLIGPVGLAASYASAWAGQPAGPDGETPGVLSHARVNEIGVLYMAVAGMLNLLAIIDSAHRAGRLLEET